MSVEKYYPFNGERGRLRLGLQAIEFSDWLQYEEDFKNRIEQKKQLIKTEGKRVLDSLPDAIDAQEEFLQLLFAYLQKHHSSLFKITSDSVVSNADKNRYVLSEYEACPLELASYLVGDDICLLQEEGEDYKLVAASVCAPTWWDLPEKMGKPLASIHAPIANLENKIGRMIRHFMKSLKVEDCYQRSNWFLFTSEDYCVFPNSFDFVADMSDVSKENIESKLFLRTERQTFRRLPNTNHIAFGIKVYVDSIAVVKKQRAIAEDLMYALNTMGVEQKHGLGISYVEKPLTEYLQNVLQSNA